MSEIGIKGITGFVIVLLSFLGMALFRDFQLYGVFAIIGLFLMIIEVLLYYEEKSR